MYLLPNNSSSIKLILSKAREGRVFEENWLLNSSRMICAIAFARVKRNSAVSQIYRNRIPNFDDSLMLTAAGLWNFYLMVV